MNKFGENGLKKHTINQKNPIVGSYLSICKTLYRKYDNFEYIETHGGKGIYTSAESGKNIDGSVLMAAKSINFPIHAIEVNQDNYNLLLNCTQQYPNVNLYHNDCNDIIDTILFKLSKSRTWKLFFLDPSGYIYNETPSTVKPQLTSKTIDKIVSFPRSEVLLHFRVSDFVRMAGSFLADPDGSAAIKNSKHCTEFIGTDSWKNIVCSYGIDRKQRYIELLELLVKERFSRYKYISAFLIRLDGNQPISYLIHATNNDLGSELMRKPKGGIMSSRGKKAYFNSKGLVVYDSIFTSKGQKMLVDF